VVYKVHNAVNRRARLRVVSRARFAAVICEESFDRAFSKEAGEVVSLYGIHVSVVLEHLDGVSTFQSHDIFGSRAMVL
jgi:hypothetical protein